MLDGQTELQEESPGAPGWRCPFPAPVQGQGLDLCLLNKKGSKKWKWHGKRNEGRKMKKEK